MNGIVIHFFYSSVETVLKHARSIGICNENCISENEEHFYFSEYRDYAYEYEPQEKREIEELIGEEPTCSFTLECRYSHGRFALAKLIKLVELEPAIIDDDLGGLWDLTQLKTAYSRSVSATIYNIGEYQS